MNAKIWSIIGGVALVLALLSPLVLGSAQKVERLFEAAEALSERLDYEGAIVKYKEALKESKKLGAKTERIDKDFTTLANLKIARCYYELAEGSSDVRHYQSALMHIKEVALDAQVVKHQEELTYLWAETLYKTGKLDQAKSKFSWLIENFSNNRWVPKALYTVAEINYQQQNYDTARETFQKLISEFSHSEFKADAEQRIVELKYLADNGQDSPDPPIPDPKPQDETMFKAASDLKAQGRIHETYQLYIDLITQFPESEYVTDAYVGIAEVYLEAEDYENARANYEEAMYSTGDEKRKTEIYKKYQLTYLVPIYARDQPRIEYIRSKSSREDAKKNQAFVEATRLRVKGDHIEAAKKYEEISNTGLSTEDAVRALYWAGVCYHRASFTNPTLFEKSAGTFQKLIRNYGDNPHVIEIYHRLILVYKDWAEKLGDKSKWSLIVETVKKVNKKYAHTDSDLDRQWLGRMEPIKDMALQQLPSKAKVKTNLNTETEWKTKTKVEKEPKTETGISTKTPKETYVNQGYTHLERRELEIAVQKSRQALRIDKTYQRAHQLLSAIKQTHYGQGLAFLDVNHYEKAIAEFKESINIDPKFKEAYCNLGVSYIENEAYTKATVSLQKAIDIDPNFIEAHFNLSLAYLRLGRFEDARNEANTILSINPNYEPALQLLDSIAD